jgi:hypothetical protein
MSERAYLCPLTCLMNTLIRGGVENPFNPLFHLMSADLDRHRQGLGLIIEKKSLNPKP